MGEIIVRKVRGMNWKAKISLVLIFTMVFSTFMYQGWYSPKPAQAAIAPVTAWTVINDTNPNTLTPNVTSASTFNAGGSTGQNRLLLVGVVFSTTTTGVTMTGSLNSIAVTYGGQSVTKLIGGDDGTTAGRGVIWLGYIKDALIPAGANSVTVTGTVTGTNVTDVKIFCASFNGVDQTTPFTDQKWSQTTASAATGTAVSLNYNANDYPILFSYNNVASLTASSYTPAKYTSAAASSTTLGSANVANITTTPPSNITGESTNVTYSGNGRIGIIAASMKLLACSDSDVATLTTTNPTSSATVGGTVTIQAQVGVETTPSAMTGMHVDIGGAGACNVAGGTMTWNGTSSRWEYSWNTSACGTGTPVTGVTVDVSGNDPDCGTTVNAAQRTGITINNVDSDPATLTIIAPAGGATVRGTQTVQVQVGTETQPQNMTGMHVDIAGAGTCNVTGGTMTWNGTSSRWEYSWDTSACGTGSPVTGVTVNASGNDPDNGATKNATQITVSIDNGDPSKIGSCAGCHGYTGAFSDGASRNDSGAFPGSHNSHVVQGAAVCSVCHVTPATETASDYGHRNGNIQIRTNINGDTGGQYGSNRTSWAQTQTPTFDSCSNVYCHSQGTSNTTQTGETRTTVATPLTTLTWGTNNAVCSSCHGFPPSYTNGATTWGAAKRNSHGSHSSNPCQTCHNLTTTDGATITGPTHHADKNYDISGSNIGSYTYNVAGGTCNTIVCHGNANAQWGVTVVGCTDCHSVAQAGTHGTPRSAITTEFGLAWGHKKSGRGTVANADCIVCHLEGNYTTQKTSSYHADGNIDLRDPDGAGETPITNNSGGAFTFQKYSISYAAGSRTTTLGNTVAEVLTVKFCLKCHDSDGATNTTARSNNGGTGTAAMPFGGIALGANYTATNGAIGTQGLINVASQVLSTNSSRHPVGAPNNRAYPASTRLAAPYNGVGTARDANTATGNTASPRVMANSVVIVCEDCHTVDTAQTATPSLLDRTVTAHGGAVGLRGTYFVASPTLCVGCHQVTGQTTTNGYLTSSQHGAGSALTTGNSNIGTNTRTCNMCHFSNQTAPVRPIKAADIHGFNGMLATGGAWTYGNANGMRPIAFLRNVAWATTSPRPYVATTGGPGQFNLAAGQSNCGGNATLGSCSNQNHSNYSPGGSY